MSIFVINPYMSVLCDYKIKNLLCQFLCDRRPLECDRTYKCDPRHITPINQSSDVTCDPLHIRLKLFFLLLRWISLETFGNCLLDLTTLSPICGCVLGLVSCKNSSTTKTGPQDIAESAIKHPKKIIKSISLISKQIEINHNVFFSDSIYTYKRLQKRVHSSHNHMWSSLPVASSWFFPPSFTTKTGPHDIAEIAWNTKKNQSPWFPNK